MLKTYCNINLLSMPNTLSCILMHTKYGHATQKWTKGVNKTFISRSEDVLGVFWKPYVHSVNVLYPGGSLLIVEIMFKVNYENTKRKC